MLAKPKSRIHAITQLLQTIKMQDPTAYKNVVQL